MSDASPPRKRHRLSGELESPITTAIRDAPFRAVLSCDTDLARVQISIHYNAAYCHFLLGTVAASSYPTGSPRLPTLAELREQCGVEGDTDLWLFLSMENDNPSSRIKIDSPQSRAILLNSLRLVGVPVLTEEATLAPPFTLTMAVGGENVPDPRDAGPEQVYAQPGLAAAPAPSRAGSHHDSLAGEKLRIPHPQNATHSNTCSPSEPRLPRGAHTHRQ